MLGRKGVLGGSLRVLLRSLLVWTACAAGLLLTASLILSKMGTGSAMLGYVSSAISFVCAVAAGAYCKEQQGKNGLVQSLILAGVLILLLLTLGFLIRGKDMDASGILSVVSFTAAGCLLGGLFFGKGTRKKRAKHRVFGGDKRRKFT